MKKRGLFSVTVAFVIALAITGCFARKHVQTPTQPVQTTAEETSPVETEPQTMGVNDTLHLSERTLYRGQQDLYYLASFDELLEEVDAQQCRCDLVGVIGNDKIVLRLLNYGGYDDLTIYDQYIVYDLDTNRVIGPLNLDGYVSVTHGYIVQYDSYLKKVQFYDASLTKVQEYALDGPDSGLKFYGGTELFPLYMHDLANDLIFQVTADGDSLQMNKLNLPGYSNYLIDCSVDGNQIYAYRLETIHFRTEAYIYDVPSAQDVGYFHTNADTWIHDTLALGDGYVIAAYQIPDTSVYCFTLMDEDYKEHLLLWDTTKALENGNTLDAFETQPFVDDDEDELVIPDAQMPEFAELYAYAEQFYEKFGIHLYIADQVPSEISGFHMEPLTDVVETTRMMLVIDRILSVYPDNFLNQLMNDDVEEIDLFIADGVTTDRDDLIPVAGGFATTLGGHRIIVIDLMTDESLYDKLNHELMHLIETRLQNASIYIPDFEYNEDMWFEYNPEGFEYSYDYPNYMDYEPAYEYWDWFVSAYSTVNMGEDMAEIYGSAMYGYFMQDDVSYIEVNEFQHLNAKLSFLCAYIRASFDTTGWAEVMPWEIFVQ